MAYIKVDGFDEINDELEQLSKQASKLSGTATFGELFDDGFMQEHTQYSNIEEFFKRGGFIIDKEEDFDAISQDELDKHTAKTTDFENWEDMIGTAVEEFHAKELGFD